MEELSIGADTVFRLIEILRELAGQDRGLDRENADGEGDDASTKGLAGEPGDARSGEIVTLLNNLNVDERTDLVALMLVGRDEFDLTDWDGAKSAAQEQLETGSVGELFDLVIGGEASAEFLEAGLNAFGYDFSEWDAEAVATKPERGSDNGPGDIADDAQRQIPGRVDTR